MKKTIRIILLVINIISFGLVGIIGLSGIIYELFGPALYENLLEWFNIPWRFEQFWTFSFICLAVLIITFILRKRFFGNEK